MSEAAQESQSTETQQGESQQGGEDSAQQEQTQTFTQADVDKIIGKTRTEERRKAAEKYADYDDLRTKAEGAKTLEDRVADIERQAKENEIRALRAEIANAKGLTPTQAKRLVGSSREELEADADELIADLGERKKQGNHVPGEGNNTTAQGGEGASFARALFGTATDGG